MRFTAVALQDRGVRDDRIWLSLERSMNCAIGHCGHCQLGPLFICKDGPVLRHDVVEPLMRGGRAVSAKRSLAVWKFASCDGCQLSILDCEDELLALAGELDIAYFLEAGSRARSRTATTSRSWRARSPPPHDAERIREIRARSRRVVSHRRVRHRRRHPGAAQLRRRRGLRVGRLRQPAVHLHAGRLDADLRPRRGRLRAPRLPAGQGPAAGGHQRLPQRAPAGDRRRTASASSASAAATSA